MKNKSLIPRFYRNIEKCIVINLMSAFCLKKMLIPIAARHTQCNEAENYCIFMQYRLFSQFVPKIFEFPVTKCYLFIYYSVVWPQTHVPCKTFAR